jgi:acetate kinase
MPSRSILVVNSGSSSLKFALFTLGPDAAALCRGTVDLSERDSIIGGLLARVASEVDAAPLAGIGHRIVHGGRQYHDAVLATDEVLAELEGLVAFAPNHLPLSLALVGECRRLLPAVPQVLCFDTAFHAGLPDIARRLPIPREYHDRGLVRYGFHGLSYTSLMNELRRTTPADLANGRIVLAHLGSGSSLAAVRAGRSIDTSMAFTPISGVVMSTRPGDLDPGVVTYLSRAMGRDADRIDHLLSHESGLAGIAGRDGDMREILERQDRDDNCRLAVSIYCYEIRKRIGAYAAALEGLDGLVFSGGIGEHAPAVRARICEGLAFLGVEIDMAQNAANAPVISTDRARVSVRVIRSDEEFIIARDAGNLLTA